MDLSSLPHLSSQTALLPPPPPPPCTITTTTNELIFGEDDLHDEEKIFTKYRLLDQLHGFKPHNNSSLNCRSESGKQGKNRVRGTTSSALRVRRLNLKMHGTNPSGGLDRMGTDPADFFIGSRFESQGFPSKLKISQLSDRSKSGEFLYSYHWRWLNCPRTANGLAILKLIGPVVIGHDLPWVKDLLTMYSISSSCISAYACIASQAEASPVLFVVFIVSILAATSFVRLRHQTRKDEKGKIAEITPMEQIIIDNQNLVSIPGPPLPEIHQVLDASSCLSGLSENITNEGGINIVQFPRKSTSIDMPAPVSTVLHSICKTPQVLNTSIPSVGPRISTDKVESNENVAAREQTNGDISDPASLLHQPLIEGQETSSFHIEHPNNLLPEAQETTSEIANDDSRVTSQPAEQPNQAAEVAESEARVPELKTAAKVSYWVMPISAGGIVSILAGLIGEEKTDLGHKVVLFNAFKSLTFISFVLGVLLFILSTLRPANTRGLVMVVKITRWIILGSITYAITCATSIILVKSLVDVVIVLIVPLVIVFVLIIVSLSIRRT
ncbi:hypothetical protein BVC80_8863g24 [Macleaya cordata]|uniref:Transmembrane protein n=1 Tax=Macleaya cordata TaxID=56857 RepID=A0A200Q5H5_MACCD|nr:hypothetical protein BVC80_8863g24 [Macleaya cordata]